MSTAGGIAPDSPAGIRRLLATVPRGRALLAVASALAAIVLGFLSFDAPTAQSLIYHHGYWLLLAHVAWFAILLGRTVRTAASAASRAGLLAVGTVLGTTILCLVAEPPREKILYDEHVLQSTAQSLHLNRQVGTIVRGYEVNGVFLALHHYLDKRPSFFPFLLSVVHDVTGYRRANVYVLNAALTLLTLSLLYVVARRLAGPSAALVAVVAFGTLPLMAQNSTGAGMEVLNLAMILGCAWLAMVAIERPDGPACGALVLGMALLAQTRYESALFVVALGLVLPVVWWRAGRVRLEAALIAFPLLLIPIPLTQAVLQANPIMWDLREGLESRFSPIHVRNNLEHAARFFFSWDAQQPNSLWLTLVGVLGAAAGVAAALARPARLFMRPERWVLAAFGAVIVGNLALLMFYFWGELDDPMVSRLSLPGYLLLALAAAAFLARLDRHGPATRVALLLSLAAVPLIYGRAVPKHTYTAHNLVAAELRWEMEWVRARGSADRIILTNKSSLPWLLDRTPALMLDHARERADEIRHQLGDSNFHEILVMQRLRPTSAQGDFAVQPEDRLPAEFRLETLAERRFGAGIDRISRLVAVDRPGAAQP